MANDGALKQNAPGVFPNDSHMRGKDRKLRRELPASDGNPRRVNNGARRTTSTGITPEGLRPSATLSAPHGKFGLSAGDGLGM